MCHDEFDGAEQYLQMAARWSQTSTDSATALNNLGTLSWMKLGNSLSLREGNSDTEQFMQRNLLHFSKKAAGTATVHGTKKGVLSKSELLLLSEALNYWEDAAEECTSDKHDNSNAQQVTHNEVLDTFCVLNRVISELTLLTAAGGRCDVRCRWSCGRIWDTYHLHAE